LHLFSYSFYATKNKRRELSLSLKNFKKIRKYLFVFMDFSR